MLNLRKLNYLLKKLHKKSLLPAIRSKLIKELKLNKEILILNNDLQKIRIPLLKIKRLND